MAQTSGGGPAFPRSGFEFSEDDRTPTETLPQDGMSLRDYLAAKAMQGMLASGKWGVSEADTVSRWSYAYADAMLKAQEGT